MKEIAGEWIEAVAELNTTESRQILLSFVDLNMKVFGLIAHSTLSTKNWLHTLRKWPALNRKLGTDYICSALDNSPRERASCWEASLCSWEP